MSRRFRHNVVQSCSGVLAVLAMMSLVAVTTGAQGTSVTAKSPSAMLAGAVDSAQRTPPRAPSKGQREGVTIHGHWTIEVRNPDGKVASHLDFENHLCTSALGDSFGGDMVLAGLLSGRLSAGPWAVFLNVGQVPSGTNPAPPCPIGTATEAFTLATSNSFCNVGNYQNFPAFESYISENGYGCDTNLQLLSGSPNQLTLTGQLLVPQGTPSLQITSVNTMTAPCVLGAGGQSPTCGQADDFTATYLPSAIAVSPGQTILVTVQITFS